MSAGELRESLARPTMASSTSQACHGFLLSALTAFPERVKSKVMCLINFHLWRRCSESHPSLTPAGNRSCLLQSSLCLLATLRQFLIRDQRFFLFIFSPSRQETVLHPPLFVLRCSLLAILCTIVYTHSLISVLCFFVIQEESATAVTSSFFITGSAGMATYLHIFTA